jgi:hypothetical protein
MSCGFFVILSLHHSKFSFYVKELFRVYQIGYREFGGTPVDIALKCYERGYFYKMIGSTVLTGEFSVELVCFMRPFP